MKLFILLFVISFSAMAQIKEVTIPELLCGDKLFQEVRVTVDTSRVKLVNRRDVCIRLLRKARKQKISRFVMDEMAPKHLGKLFQGAEDFFRLIQFKPSIIGRSQFDFTAHDVQMILETVSEHQRMRVATFDQEGRRRTMAYHRGDTMYFNADRLDRSRCELINTLVHEYMHNLGYGHGDDLPEGKGGSVPYYFGDRAQELCEARVI